VAEHKGPLPDWIRSAFQGKRTVILHGVEYHKAEDVPDAWRTLTREEFLARRELGAYVPEKAAPGPVIPGLDRESDEKE
jgi:hypothetical protein